MNSRTTFAYAALAAALAYPAAAQGVAPDWIVLKATVDPGGASNVSLSVFGVRGGDGSTPVVSGIGIGNSEVGGTTVLHGKGHGPSRISTTATAGSVELELSADGPHAEDFGAVWGFLDSYDEGTASSTATVGTGLVGGYAGFEFCIVCVGTTFAPNAERIWTYTTTPGTPVTGKTGSGRNVPFAGPAGSWEWRWAGVGAQGGITTPSGTPVYGAWAPIGDDWPLFDAYIGYDDPFAIPELP